jgi:hypothetical protein
MGSLFEIETSRHASCPPDVVHGLLVHPSSWPRWQPEIHSTDHDGSMAPGDVARGEAQMLGFEVHGHSTATDVGPRFFEEDVVVGVRMRIRYDLAPTADGVVITHRLNAQLPGGPSGRVLSFFLRRRLRRLQRMALDRLATHSEADCS